MSEEEIRILSTATCPSLSERSTLTYDIGCDKNKTIYLRLTGNTGAGIFSKSWTGVSQLEPLTSEDKPITAKMIRTLFQGKSVNTTGFIIAALIAEGLLKVSDESQRTYIRTDPTEFQKNMQLLMNSMSGSSTSIDEKPAKAKKNVSLIPESQT